MAERLSLACVPARLQAQAVQAMLRRGGTAAVRLSAGSQRLGLVLQQVSGYQGMQVVLRRSEFEVGFSWGGAWMIQPCTRLQLAGSGCRWTVQKRCGLPPAAGAGRGRGGHRRMERHDADADCQLLQGAGGCAGPGGPVAARAGRGGQVAGSRPVVGGGGSW